MAAKKSVDVEQGSQITAADIATAFKEAMESAKPPQKKTIFTREKQTPWTPPPGQPKLKLKRKMHLHGIPLRETYHSNEEIALMNKLRPGSYLDDYVKVYKRNDKGLNIDYPAKTTAQRLKLVNRFGISSLKNLLERIVDEASRPKKSEFDLDSEE